MTLLGYQKAALFLIVAAAAIYLFVGATFEVRTAAGTMGEIARDGERVSVFVPEEGCDVAASQELGPILVMGPAETPLLDPSPEVLLVRAGGDRERMTVLEILGHANGRDYLLLATRDAIASLGPYGPIVFVALYALGTVIFFSAILMTVLGGLTFGPWWGTLWVLTGATLGASASFSIGRWAARGTVERFLPEGARALSGRLESHGFLAILLLRLIPVCPYNILNYACGVSRMRYRDYLLGGLIGMAPILFLWVQGSHAAMQVRLGDPYTWLPIGLLALLLVVPHLLGKRRSTGKEAPGTG